MTIVCIACGETSHFILKSVSIGRMLQCKSCKLVFVDPPWTDELAKTTWEAWDGWPGGIAGGQDNCIQNMQLVSSIINNHYPKGGRLLDVGCAHGIFFKTIQSYLKDRSKHGQWEYSGSEPGDKWKNHVYPNAEVKNSTLRGSQYNDNSFDVITYLDVFYYVSEPQKEFAEIHRVLTPNGRLIFDLSNQKYLKLRDLLGRFLKMDRTDLFSAYPFYYSYQATSHMLHNSGFSFTAIPSRGAVPEELFLKLATGLFFNTLNIVSKLIPQLIHLYPRLIYIAKPNGQ